MECVGFILQRGTGIEAGSCWLQDNGEIDTTSIRDRQAGRKLQMTSQLSNMSHSILHLKQTFHALNHSGKIEQLQNMTKVIPP